MTMLRDLLPTWENWSARDTLTRALGHAQTETPDVSALDALRDSTELVELLTGWQWQAIHTARRDGATRAEVTAVLKVNAEQARADYAEVLDRQERILGGDVSVYREVLRLLALAARSGPRDDVHRRLWAFYNWCAVTDVPELHTLAATIETWWPAVEVFLTTGVTNRLVKQVKRTACGFRNRGNYRIRVRLLCTRSTRRFAA